MAWCLVEIGNTLTLMVCRMFLSFQDVLTISGRFFPNFAMLNLNTIAFQVFFFLGCIRVPLLLFFSSPLHLLNALHLSDLKKSASFRHKCW